jgi:hypothetical protein
VRPYFSYIFSANLLQILNANHDIESRSLLTVIDNAAGHDITSAWLNETLERYLQEDDAIKPDFFATILVVGPAEIESQVLQTRWGTSHVQPIHFQGVHQDVFGSHIIYGESLWQVFRLYDDVR